MRYVGNMRRNTMDNSRKQNEKAVFPPGSVVPENFADNAEMYRENMNENQQENSPNNLRENSAAGRNNAAGSNNTNEDSRFQENLRQETNPENLEDNMHGFMDYYGMEFPLPNGDVLKRTDSGNNMDYVGTAKDPAGFSPANGLEGRPAESMPNISEGAENTMPGSFRQGMTNNNTMPGSLRQDMTNNNTMPGSFRQGMPNNNTMPGSSRQVVPYNNMLNGQQRNSLDLRNNTMMGSFRNSMSSENPISGTFHCGSVVSLSDMMCMYRGKNVEIEFMFGADTYVKKSGILSGAGINFIVLTDNKTGQRTVCDLKDMKFLNFLDNGSDSE